MNLIDKVEVWIESLVEACIRRLGVLAVVGWGIALYLIGYTIGRSME